MSTDKADTKQEYINVNRSSDKYLPCLYQAGKKDIHNMQRHPGVRSCLCMTSTLQVRHELQQYLNELMPELPEYILGCERLLVAISKGN